MYRWWWDVYGAFLVWLAFMIVVGGYVVRIGLLLREQQHVERAYRLWLARRTGRAVRDASSRENR